MPVDGCEQMTDSWTLCRKQDIGAVEISACQLSGPVRSARLARNHRETGLPGNTPQLPAGARFALIDNTKRIQVSGYGRPFPI
ncbi:MAG: hypothetical protein CMO06_00840 [Thalassospira sp.]|nr:hypothetical protein [Thalassospira sp.]